MALPPQKLQIKRTQTDNNPPPDGTLAPGELSVEMGTPTRLWVGVPAAISATLKKLLFDSSASYVAKAGDTMSGDLHITKATPSVWLDKTATGQNAAIRGTLNGIARWVMQLGDTSAESGGNAGSDFVLRRFDDSGGSIDAPLTIARATGRMSVNGDPTVPLGVATKQYVDSRPAVLRSYLAGLQFSTAGSSSFTIAPGVACDSTAVDMMVLSAAMTKTTAAWSAGSGGGGLDTGIIQNQKWYCHFVIKNPTTGVVDVLTSLSPTAPTLPPGFTLFRRIASTPTNVTPVWQIVNQLGDEFMWPQFVPDFSGTAPAASSVLITLSVPSAIRVNAKIWTSTSNVANQITGILYSSPDVADVPASGSALNAGYSTSLSGNNMAIYLELMLRAVNGQIRARAFSVDQSTNISTIGWIDRRGRDD